MKKFLELRFVYQYYMYCVYGNLFTSRMLYHFRNMPFIKHFIILHFNEFHDLNKLVYMDFQLNFFHLCAESYSQIKGIFLLTSIQIPRKKQMKYLRICSLKQHLFLAFQFSTNNLFWFKYILIIVYMFMLKSFTEKKTS